MKHYESFKAALANPLEVEWLTIQATSDPFVVPQEVLELKNLKKLILQNGSADPKEIQNSEILKKFTNLQSLTLYLYKLQAIPWGVYKLRYLKELLLYNWQITSLPESIGNLTNLEYLQLSSVPLISLPSEISKLQKLKKINIESCKLSEIPKPIFLLKNLEELDIRNNTIREIPKGIIKLEKLTKLLLAGNKISEIPKEIADMNLETLFAKRNEHLKVIPIEIINKIRRVDIEDTKFPPELLASKSYKSKNALKFLRSKLSDYKRTAFIPTVEEKKGSLINSKYGGKPFLQANEEYPICPICKNPMQFFFQLNLSEIPEFVQKQFGKSGLLQFFYCNSKPTVRRLIEVFEKQPELLNKHQKATLKKIADAKQTKLLIEISETKQSDQTNFDKLDKVGLSYINLNFLLSDCEYLANDENYKKTSQIVRIISVKEVYPEILFPANHEFFPEKIITSWEEIEDYPNYEFTWKYYETYELLTEKDKKRINKLHYFALDKLGGWPSWLQDVYYPKCNESKKEMNNFVFQIRSENHIPYMWGDGACCYIVQCPENKNIVSAYNQG